MAECKARRSDGSAYHAPAMDGSDLCFWHNPESQAVWQQASRRGGGRRAVELPEAESLAPERDRAILAGVIEAAASGAMDSGTARTVFLFDEAKLLCAGATSCRLRHVCAHGTTHRPKLGRGLQTMPDCRVEPCSVARRETATSRVCEDVGAMRLPAAHGRARTRPLPSPEKAL